MAHIARTLTPTIGLIALIGLTSCLKPNPLAQIELAGDDDDATDTGTSDDPMSDLLDGTCQSPPEIEVACGECLIETCCTSLGPCGEDPICVCEAACVFTGESQPVCRVLCSAMTPGDPEPLAPLLQCADQNCPDCFVE